MIIELPFAVVGLTSYVNGLIILIIRRNNIHFTTEYSIIQEVMYAIISIGKTKNKETIIKPRLLRS